MAERILELTVIGDKSCSTTRTYLSHLKGAGMRVRRLWLVDFGAESRRRRMLRRILGAPLCDALLRWHAGRTSRPQADDSRLASLCLRLQQEAGFAPIDHFAAWKPEDHAQEIRRFRATDFNDPGLQSRVLAARDSAFLYTNGGMVPGGLLGQPDLRMLHIHPGIVPDLRGSDCLLWSAAVRRRLGVSCFYMSAGIDEGMILGQREFELPRLPSLVPLMNPADEPLAYRALLFAVDPHLRASLLVDVLRTHPQGDLRNLPGKAQAPASRPAYLWMHPRLRLQTMKEAFA